MTQENQKEVVADQDTRPTLDIDPATVKSARIIIDFTDIPAEEAPDGEAGIEVQAGVFIEGKRLKDYRNAREFIDQINPHLAKQVGRYMKALDDVGENKLGALVAALKANGLDAKAIVLAGESNEGK